MRDSNDRHANADTNHLLHLVEQHNGLVILSTNRRANIDPAFIRRLRHVVDFPKPGPVERRLIWEVMLGALDSQLAISSEVFDDLAALHELSPAQIKSAALTAQYSAIECGRPIAAEDLNAAAQHELTKEGRSATVAGNQPRRARQRRDG